MATVARKVCDIDSRDDGVVEVTIKVGGAPARVVDLCERCMGSTKFSTVLDKSHRPKTGKSPKRFAKTDLPPQPL